MFLHLQSSNLEMEEHITYSLSFLSLSVTVLFITISVLIFHFFLSPQSDKTPSCPNSYPVLGNLPGLLLNRHRFHDWVADMLSSSPTSTVRVPASFFGLSSPGICTADPANVHHLLAANLSNYVKGSRFQNVLRELLGGGIFAVDGVSWALQRKISSHEFNTKSLKHFLSDVVNSEISNRLLPLLNEACEENRVVDLQDLLQKFTFGNLCRVAFGVDPASMDCTDFIQAFDFAVENGSSRFMNPVQAIWKLKRFFNIGSENKFKKAIEVINSFSMEIVKSKEEEIDKAENRDLLSRFMEASSSMEFQDQERGRKFLRDIIISFMLAGKDSTSTALTWFFWLMAGNPGCARSILSELTSSCDVTVAERRRLFAYDELKRLNYLHAAISESMRLFPPVPINSRLTVDDDMLPDGTRVGSGWFADYSAYAMGRMEKIWGGDCREFRPERWLDSAGVFQPADQFRYPVFHGGPRMCLGKQMAYIQMKSIVAAVMREFEIMAVDGGATAEKMANPPYTLSLLLKMRGGLPIRVRRRRH